MANPQQPALGDMVVAGLELAFSNSLANIQESAADPAFPLAAASADLAALVQLLRPQWPANPEMAQDDGPPNILAYL